MCVFLHLMQFINVTDFKSKKAWVGFLELKCTVDIMPIQFRPHLLSAQSVPGAILGIARTEVGDQSWVPTLEELLLSLGYGHLSNAE